jgi:hypothetical protein
VGFGITATPEGSLRDREGRLLAVCPDCRQARTLGAEAAMSDETMRVKRDAQRAILDALTPDRFSGVYEEALAAREAIEILRAAGFGA